MVSKLFKKITDKIYFKFIAFDYRIDRLIRYHDPKKYWEKRGGNTYFSEQEAELRRTLRSQFIADHVRRLSYANLLEVGCGYGKQLKNLSSKKAKLIGCDFSRPQLMKAMEYCQGLDIFPIEADAEALPFASQSFDVVMSSAVVLHNEPQKAQKIISEMIRVTRKFLVHNEDTDVNFSRYGYDMARIYEALGFPILVSEHIPYAPDPAIPQFTIVQIPDVSVEILPEKVPLRYHSKITAAL